MEVVPKAKVPKPGKAKEGVVRQVGLPLRRDKAAWDPAAARDRAMVRAEEKARVPGVGLEGIPDKAVATASEISTHQSKISFGKEIIPCPDSIAQDLWGPAR